MEPPKDLPLNLATPRFQVELDGYFLNSSGSTAGVLAAKRAGVILAWVIVPVREMIKMGTKFGFPPSPVISLPTKTKLSFVEGKLFETKLPPRCLKNVSASLVNNSQSVALSTAE